MNPTSSSRFVHDAQIAQDRLMEEINALPAGDPSTGARFLEAKSEIQAQTMVMRVGVQTHQSLLRKLVNEIR